jgi:hypothetical protein
MICAQRHRGKVLAESQIAKNQKKAIDLIFSPANNHFHLQTINVSAGLQKRTGVKPQAGENHA